jgi:hypothetical protein
VRKIDQQFHKLEEALERRGRKLLYAGDPRLRNLPEFLRPRRRPQDRGLSGWAGDLLLGAAASETVIRAAGIHLRRWEEGTLHHVALEVDDA